MTGSRHVGSPTASLAKCPQSHHVQPHTHRLRPHTVDTFAPIGPSILVNPLLFSSSDSFNPNNLGVRCFVNDKKVQDSNTREFIFNVQTVVAYISRIVTLKPGDLIFTGTPPGVGMGMKPPVYLKVGDKMRVEIDELGAIENPVIAP